ncbi:Pol protein [Phytophthora palmivora]|uniref:Pol protein n=1 Tax=Phytophthora palmivora TaxID=4796 RepID=A0A2P4XJW0_9STRA|nr:Pol protein [Phytophthora palmivora]
MRKSSGMLVIHASVWGYGDPFRILIDSGTSTNFARRQTVARNGDKYADALRESKGRGQVSVVSVRLADVTVVNVPEVRMYLAVKFEDFDRTEAFLALDMDKYDLILGTLWLEKHEPWIHCHGEASGASRPAVSDRALVSNVPTSVRDWGDRDGRQGAYAPEEVLGVTDSSEDVAMSLATGRETKVHCQACGIATTASPNAESRRAVWASTVAVPDGTDQAGNIGPQAGNIGPQAAEAAAAEEDAEGASGVGNIVPHKVEETEKKNSAACVSSVGNRVPRGVKKTSTSAEVSLSTSRVDNQVPHSESETPPARPVEEQCHVFDGVSGRQVRAGAVHLEALPEVSALLNLDESSMKDFLAELKAGNIAEMVLLKPETSPEDLNSSSILKNPDDPVYPLVKGYSDVVSKYPSSQLPPDRGCEVIDALFAKKAKSGMVRESKSPHLTPTFCVHKPNGKWHIVHAYKKLNNATVPTQTPIPRKGVLLNNMSGCTQYSALDLVDGYYQILMRESIIPLIAMSTPSGMLWEWLVIPRAIECPRDVQSLGYSIV